ncbi:short chain dehydrogenase [Staphylococcus massiliensis]|uniref:Short chain dehydrogenase n=1 Tax=Staphylococcus massiliensis S46 TaxID=1229783 RepID=K9B8F3_9STAP|nr:short chain dehydrogenase [Staphylococcus massiliensis]EKU50025.1 short chain dehydrogenase [Staphylococcus massiliensis S46]MCG3399215.1 short chain dehydrogenase [Staphylococcus massiliensis]MCG3402268.1 short chain dehydrogenase [Staphylococcus massiliensis]MCG3413409.1 short chain dehydrogenase [Staphylococcus massiliensis]POA00287.1 short chain dehydrogenase [Staphylococcus massiliensis CCUG 55927]
MKVVVIGASGTIGKEVSQKLKELNHDVIEVGLSSGDYQIDITKVNDIKQMYNDIKNIDAVVSATGAATFQSLKEMTVEDNQVAINSKLLGQINLVLIGQHYLNHNGSFTLTSGIMMDDPIELGSSAAMANGGIAGFVTSAAIELQNGLRINNVSPNVVEEALDKYGDFFKGFNPRKVSEVANAYVKSVEGKQTGQTYKVY